MTPREKEKRGYSRAGTNVSSAAGLRGAVQTWEVSITA